MPHRLNTERPIYLRSVRSASLSANAFELFVCLLALVAAISFFINPDTYDDTAVGQFLHPYDFVWNMMYGLGALLVVVGLVRLKPQIEVAGLCLFTSAVSINFVATLTVYGTVSFLSAAPIYLGFAMASLIRAHYLISMNVRNLHQRSVISDGDENGG